MDLGKRIQSEIIGRPGDGHTICQPILAPVAWTLEPELARARVSCVARIYEAPQMDACNIESDHVLEDGI